MKDFGRKLMRYLTVITCISVVAMLAVVGYEWITKNIDKPIESELIEIDGQKNSIFSGELQDIPELTYETDDDLDELLAIDGVKLNDAYVCEVGKYINFTIPYGWSIGRIEVDDDYNQEVIILTNDDDTMMTISLRNAKEATAEEELSWTREVMIHTISNSYSNYDFERLPITDDRVATTKFVSADKSQKGIVTIISANEKTIIVSYFYKQENFFEADLYYTMAIAEMIQSLK